jgi:hypothetical protein
MSEENEKCPYCADTHNFKCPLVKSFSYYPDGTIKGVKFFRPRPLPETDRFVGPAVRFPTVRGTLKVES